jgi:hypothetical protein
MTTSIHHSAAVTAATKTLAAICVLFACLGLVACSKPKVPDQDVPPAPQSTAPTNVTEAINQPIDDAKAIRKATEDTASDQRRAIDEATGD